LNIRQRILTLLALLTLIAAGVYTAAAQRQTVRLAYVNASGQLVIVGTDDGSRWIVSNPDEALVRSARFAWSPGGETLFFAVQVPNGSSLRLATLANQSIVEAAAVPGTVTGGAWTPDGRRVVFGAGEGVAALDVGSGAVSLLVPGGQITGGETVSPDGDFLFVAHGGGYVVTRLDDPSSSTRLPGDNDAYAGAVGLWAGRQPFIAYWTFGATGTSVLNVTNAASGETLSLDSGSAVPVAPLAWLPGATTLLYRSALGVAALDASCLSGGCGNAPQPVNVLPVTADNVSASADGVLVYSTSGTVYGVTPVCIAGGNCAEQSVALGNLGGKDALWVANSTAAFTGQDGSVYAVNLGCVTEGACDPVSLGIAGAVYGLSPNGAHLLVYAGGQLQLVSLRSGGTVTLSGADSSGQTAWGG
jgi:hypothetical protein